MVKVEDILNNLDNFDNLKQAYLNIPRGLEKHLREYLSDCHTIQDIFNKKVEIEILEYLCSCEGVCIPYMLEFLKKEITPDEHNPQKRIDMIRKDILDLLK